MNFSLSQKFYLNKAKGSTAKHPLYLRITVNRKKAEMATGINIEESDWDQVKQRTKRNKEINHTLSGLENKIYQISRDLENDNKIVTATIIKDSLSGKRIVRPTLKEYAQKFIEYMQNKKELAKASIGKYQNTVLYLDNFLKEKKGGNNILMSNIDYSFLKAFDLYLMTKTIYDTEKTLERNTANKHHS